MAEFNLEWYMYAGWILWQTVLNRFEDLILKGHWWHTFKADLTALGLTVVGYRIHIFSIVLSANFQGLLKKIIFSTERIEYT